MIGVDPDEMNADTDVATLQKTLAGIPDPEKPELRCSVDEDADCDIRDLVILQRAIANEIDRPPLNALCPKNVPAGPGDGT